MTEVVLTHSYHLPHDTKQLRKMHPYAPLGTLYAAAALQQAKIPVAVFDTTLIDPEPSFGQVLRRHHPAIVVIYEDDFNFLSKMCLTTVRATAFRIAALAREAGAIVIAHGSDATDHAEQYLRKGIDFVLVGEAEQTLAELCHRLLHGEDTSSVPGAFWLDAADCLARSSIAAPRNNSWSSMPRIARELIDLGPYRAAWTGVHGYFSSNVVASRGCPYQCNWCAKPISGNKYNLRPAADVASEVRELKHLYGVEHIWFGDDVFALNRHWTEEFAQEVQRQDAVLPFKVQSRADLMTAETVDALSRAGCAEVWMGVESGSQKVLDAMDKGLRIDTVSDARKRLGSAGIRACYFLQFGYPGELWPEIQQTISLVRSTTPDDIGVSVSYPLPGTKFYDRVKSYIGSKRNWSDSDDLCATFTAAYSNEFYLSLRDALHAEVASWSHQPDQVASGAAASHPVPLLESLWERVRNLEPRTRNVRATELLTMPSTHAAEDFVSLEQLAPTGTGGSA